MIFEINCLLVYLNHNKHEQFNVIFLNSSTVLNKRYSSIINIGD